MTLAVASRAPAHHWQTRVTVHTPGQMTSIFYSGCCAACLVSPWAETLLLLKTKILPGSPWPCQSSWVQLASGPNETRAAGLKKKKGLWYCAGRPANRSSWSNWDKLEDLKRFLCSPKWIYNKWNKNTGQMLKIVLLNLIGWGFWPLCCPLLGPLWMRISDKMDTTKQRM